MDGTILYSGSNLTIGGSERYREVRLDDLAGFDCWKAYNYRQVYKAIATMHISSFGRRSVCPAPSPWKRSCLIPRTAIGRRARPRHNQWYWPTVRQRLTICSVARNEANVLRQRQIAKFAFPLPAGISMSQSPVAHTLNQKIRTNLETRRSLLLPFVLRSSANLVPTRPYDDTDFVTGQPK